MGGEGLLREWESEWSRVWGGAESDEADEGADAEDDEGEEDGDEDDEDGPRKKAKLPKVVGSKKERKITAVSQSAPQTMQAALAMPSGTAPGAVPEKRKRGRPRKVVPALAPVPAPVPLVPVGAPMGYPHQHHQQPQQAQAGAPQYLLATFALFSFFNSPLTSSTPSSASHPQRRPKQCVGRTLLWRHRVRRGRE